MLLFHVILLNENISVSNKLGIRSYSNISNYPCHLVLKTKIIIISRVPFGSRNLIGVSVPSGRLLSTFFSLWYIIERQSKQVASSLWSFKIYKPLNRHKICRIELNPRKFSWKKKHTPYWYGEIRTQLS